MKYISKSLILLGLTVVICCIVYPLVVWAIGQTVFPFQANGSLVKGPDGTVVGSKLIAQPFTKDEYFQPRPSAASYDASASASSTLGPSNYLLRDRVARALGPIVKYRSGPTAGQLVAPDVEQWFQKDVYQGAPHIVAQWADMHNGLATAWVSADPTHAAYLNDWAKAHPTVVADWVKGNPATPQPQATDLAVVFFENFSKDNPGKFPSAVTRTGPDGKPQTTIEPVKDGSDVQSIFFDMWRQDHADVDLQEVPGDMVTTSGSGLDPHITLQNAEFQLDRVSAKWAADTKRDPATVRNEIKQILQANTSAPLAGLAGEKMVNVLEVNLELRTKYGAPQ
ncbi:MAG TPA: potassium-transporting ATPase subunit C [Terriglobales bacterium]|jgi:K+-transporting ATPase ATPase C chain|nr:potassium-transporting ATPase subunit C [Terriglobales bacterium]